MAPFNIKVQDNFINWTKSNKLGNSRIQSHYKSPNLSLIKTLGNKIDEEAKQLEKGKAGLIAIQLDNTYLLGFKWKWIGDYLQQRMDKELYRNVLGVLLWNDSTWGITKRTSKVHSDCIYSECPLWDNYSRKSLYVTNKNSADFKKEQSYIRKQIERIPEYNNI